MSRNVVICMDGTNNELRVDGNTNVMRLRESLVCDPVRQLVYYDPGVGTLPEPGLFTRISQRLNRYWSLAFGTGLMRNVEEAYTYLMNYWEPGDRVYLFGFSRGAYSARVLAGLLHAVGLLPRGSENLTPYLVRLYGGTRTSRSYWRLCNKFRRTFARPVDGAKSNRIPIHFLGLWDTVSSVGWIWDPQTYPYTARNPSVRFVRHAVALDERRSFFRQNLFAPGVAGQSLDERWFPGAHADVGGGYPESEGGLWRPAFEWIVSEAERTGLHVNFAGLETALRRMPRPAHPWAERQHESLTWQWWLAEFFPKLPGRRGTIRCPRFGLGRRRQVPAGASLDRSVLERIRDHALNYKPPNLCAQFLGRVRTAPELLDRQAYETNAVT